MAAVFHFDKINESIEWFGNMTYILCKKAKNQLFDEAFDNLNICVEGVEVEESVEPNVLSTKSERDEPLY